MGLSTGSPTVFNQRKTFQFVSDHHVQKGRFFPKPSDITGEADEDVTTRSFKMEGKPKVDTEHIDIHPTSMNVAVIFEFLFIRSVA